MRGSPSCVIAVRRYVLWRGAVAAVAATSLATLIAWLILAPVAQVGAFRLAASLLGLGVLVLGGSLLRMAPIELRWDGARWSGRRLEADPVTASPSFGELEVAIDLGTFLLLRFTTRTADGRAAVRWIPVERRGLEREWHSFRCAVYSPRPAAGTASAAASDHP